MTVDEAVVAINRILAQLERETDSLVRSIDVRNIETTKLGDSRPVWLRSVELRIERKPGSEWSGA